MAICHFNDTSYLYNAFVVVLKLYAALVNNHLLNKETLKLHFNNYSMYHYFNHKASIFLSSVVNHPIVQMHTNINFHPYPLFIRFIIPNNLNSEL